MQRILFVCLGNICRSPTAEAVFRTRARQAGLGGIEVDSAGTGDWHIGAPPDPRAIMAAKARQYDLSDLRGRQVTVADFYAFSHIMAMDRQNLTALQALAPADSKAQLQLFLDYAGTNGAEVPDPYFGGTGGFDHVLDLIETASDGLITALRQPNS
ncbi:low molecular weight protein-tyrosine-phosphatase [Mariluticola halotolerans]|uniref:low molecular weight protein-tyrosine-phosphatase n=1 Tax=Mariluticola halotolerans TaxID=2909283 RepID=UPI0026E412F0|nr:low molecular weight protein-tyrosine-phosphatase [Mariluticola halotolerans]UJQ93603.1 low molecular weight phosphotyrosine protein phosphatase [Mariluticola halotolerans]